MIGDLDRLVAIAALWISAVIEVSLACHCAGWTFTDQGARCTAPLDRARCELTKGWHAISFGVNTCSRGRCE